MVEIYSKNSQSVLRTIPLSSTIGAAISPNATSVIVEDSFNLGEQGSLAKILPMDSDGYRITTDVTENTGQTFTAVLEEPVSSSGDADDASRKKKCDVEWYYSAFEYRVICGVDDLSVAGRWTLSLKLSGQALHTASLRANCPSSYFEDADGACDLCVDGADCVTPGVTLATLPLLSSYWRAGEASSKVRLCPFGAKACPGGDVRNGSATYCMDGYVGALCATCASHFFLAGNGLACVTCDDAGSFTSAIIVSSLIFTALVTGAIFYCSTETPVGIHLTKRFTKHVSLRCAAQSTDLLLARCTQKIRELYDWADVKLFNLFVTAQVLYQFTTVTTAAGSDSNVDQVYYPEVRLVSPSSFVLE